MIRRANLEIEWLELIILLPILCFETVKVAALEVALEHVSLHVEHAHRGLKPRRTLSLVTSRHVFRLP